LIDVADKCNLQPGTPGLATGDFDCPGHQHLADLAAARRHSHRGSFLGDQAFRK
jgi:hypothetical protein